MPGRKPAVAYYRVSTQKQGVSGLGLEAQQAAVKAFLGADWLPAREFVEVETGKNNSRPKLTEALAYCKHHGCQLVLAKIDRLARNVAFIANLMEGKVDFVAVDMPTVNKLTIHVVAAVAEAEADATSQRTKEALAAWRARNPERKLGSPKPIKDHVPVAGRAAQTARAAARDCRILAARPGRASGW